MESQVSFWSHFLSQCRVPSGVADRGEEHRRLDTGHRPWAIAVGSQSHIGCGNKQLPAVKQMAAVEKQPSESPAAALRAAPHPLPGRRLSLLGGRIGTGPLTDVFLWAPPFIHSVAHGHTHAHEPVYANTYVHNTHILHVYHIQWAP
ncbi:hypothetical protein COCON_G00092520, partial [Conger conger]